MMWKDAVGPSLSGAMAVLAFAGGPSVFGGRRGPSLLGGVFEKQREETPQPILGVGAGVVVDPNHPQFRGVPAGGLRSCMALGFFQIDALLVAEMSALDPEGEALPRYRTPFLKPV